MATIAVLSDSHLGFRHRQKVQRLKDYAKAFTHAVDAAMQLNPDVLAYGGDLFHQPRPDPTSMRAALKKLLWACERAQVVCSIGNHEILGHLGSTYQPILADLHRNLHVLSTDAPHLTVRAHGKNIGFHGFQYLRNRKKAEEWLGKVAGEVSGNDVNVLLLHQAVEGYLEPHEVSLRALREAAPKFNLMLFGHVHKQQKISEVFDACPAYYVGSTERISFNEAENKTGFLVFRDENFGAPEFVETPSAGMRRASIKLDKVKPQEVNARIEGLIKENSAVPLLQVNVDADLDGDLLDVASDWAERFPDHTILDVNVFPRESGGEVRLERLEVSADTLREYFDKTGRAGEKELQDTCVRLFEEYGA